MSQQQNNFVWKVTPRISYWTWPAGTTALIEDLRSEDAQATKGVNDGDIGGAAIFEVPD